MKVIPFAGEYALSEVGQTNPLRWVVLHRTDEETFVAQTTGFKCKDYFNDLVAKYHGHELSIYGFSTAKVEVNEEGLYVQLKNITGDFDTNLDLVNAYASKWNKPPVQTLDSVTDTRVIFIPKDYFVNTFYISLLTYLIRISNVVGVIDDPKFLKHPTKNIDCPFSSVYETVLKRGYSPLPVETYYFVGKAVDATKEPEHAGYVHNCGVNGWVSHMMAAKLI